MCRYVALPCTNVHFPHCSSNPFASLARSEQLRWVIALWGWNSVLALVVLELLNSSSVSSIDWSWNGIALLFGSVAPCCISLYCCWACLYFRVPKGARHTQHTLARTHQLINHWRTHHHHTIYANDNKSFSLSRVRARAHTHQTHTHTQTHLHMYTHILALNQALLLLAFNYRSIVPACTLTSTEHGCRYEIWLKVQPVFKQVLTINQQVDEINNKCMKPTTSGRNLINYALLVWCLRKVFPLKIFACFVLSN